MAAMSGYGVMPGQMHGYMQTPPSIPPLGYQEMGGYMQPMQAGGPTCPGGNCNAAMPSLSMYGSQALAPQMPFQQAFMPSYGQSMYPMQ
jgi:hypothetical protein